MTLAVGILCVYWSKCATRWWLKTYWSDRLGEEAAQFFNPKFKYKKKSCSSTVNGSVKCELFFKKGNPNLNSSL